MGLGGMRGSPEVGDLPELTGKEPFMKGRAGGGLWGLWGDMGHPAATVQSPPRAPHRKVQVLTPSGTDFRASRIVSYQSLSLLLYEMGKQYQRGGGAATVKVQRDKPVAFGDTIIIMIKTPLLLLQQKPCCQGARVCLRTSGNRTQKCKHGYEVRVATGLDSGRGAGFYHSPPGAPISRDPKGPSVQSPSTLAPKPVRPRHLTVQGRLDPGTPLHRGSGEDACRVPGASWARRGLGTGPRRAWETHPRRGGHWGKVPPARGPHTGRGTASPGGQRPRSAASRPARGRGYSPGHPHPHTHR